MLFGENLEKQKDAFLAKLQDRNSKQTVFELKGSDESLVEFMNRRRRQLAPIQRKAKERKELLAKERLAGLTHGIEDEILRADGENGYGVDEDELQEAFEDADKKKSFRDPQFFLSHYAPASVIQDQQLSLSTSFANEAQAATFDLDNDDKIQTNKQVMRWDKKKGKYINSKSTDKNTLFQKMGRKSLLHSGQVSLMNGENKETLNQQVLLKTILINVSNINNKEHLNYQTSLEMITTNKRRRLKRLLNLVLMLKVSIPSTRNQIY